MKQAISLLLILSLVLWLLAACGNAGQIPEAASEAASGDPAQIPEDNGNRDAEQYINTFITSDPSTLDCARFLGIVDRVILHSITEPLTRIQDGQVVAAGAESWEVSDDGLQYTFHLRENHWDDGEKVTAEDYAYALRRQADPQNAWSFATDFFSIVSYEAVYNGETDVSELGVKAEDDSTLIITLSEPNPAFLSTVDIFPCRQTDVVKNGDGYGAEAGTVSSCGPFKLVRWVHNSVLEFEKNEQYWDRDNVALSRFTDQVMDDEGTQMNSLENGSIDYAAVSAAEYAAKFAAREDMYALTVTTDRTSMVVFNCEDPVFSNMKIRQAFSLALDREMLIALTNGGMGTPAYGLIPTVCYVGETNYRAATPEPLFSLLDATPDPKALLIEGMEEAGLGSEPSALTVSFTYGNTSAAGRTYAEVYQQLWQDNLGIKVEIDFNESALASILEGNYQIGSVGWGSTYEPIFQLSRWATGGQSRWLSDEYAALVAEGSASMDDADRLEKYQEAEALLITEAAIAPVYYNATRTYAYNYVGGIPPIPLTQRG